MIRLYNILDKIASWVIAPLTVETQAGSVTVPAGTGAAAQIPVTKSGYYPLAVVGFQVSGDSSGFADVRQLRMNNPGSGSGTAYFYVWNNSNTQRTWTVTAHVLWLKEIGGGYCLNVVFSMLSAIFSIVRRWRHEQTVQHFGQHRDESPRIESQDGQNDVECGFASGCERKRESVPAMGKGRNAISVRFETDKHGLSEEHWLRMDGRVDEVSTPERGCVA